MSDIVFMRTWCSVTPKNYYNPVTNLLLASTGKEENKWNGVRLHSQIREAKQVSIPAKNDSYYKVANDKTDLLSFNRKLKERLVISIHSTSPRNSSVNCHLQANQRYHRKVLGSLSLLAVLF